MEFPRFDLSKFESATGAQRRQLSAVLDTICSETGFVVLEGHGVPDEMIERQWSVINDFFDAPSSVKEKVKVPYSGYPYGWIGPDQEALAASKGELTPPDLKESFNGGPLFVPEKIQDRSAYDFCYQPTLWPDVSDFQNVWESYYAEMERLAQRVMSAFAEALGLENSYFDKFIDHPISALRALHYPATKSSILQKQQRAGAHTDYGSLTILLPQEGTSGLQIKRGDEWIDVPAPKNCFVINIGDLMELWTGGRWVSTLHRVIAKPDQAARKSIAYFHQPNWDAVIKPMQGADYEEVISGPYLMNKFKSTNL